MLQGRDLHHRYDPTGPWVLEHCDITVHPGEVVGLAGPSGRGKTTLARILAGYLLPHHGHVAVDGGDLGSRRGRCPVQLVFQHPETAVNPRWRAQQILTEGGTPDPALLDALRIDGSWLHRWPHELSGGELQRLAVAHALAGPTRYLIADEMTTMLDADTQAQLWPAVLDHATRHDLGVLVISHDEPLLQRLTSRIERLAAPRPAPEAEHEPHAAQAEHSHHHGHAHDRGTHTHTHHHH